MSTITIDKEEYTSLIDANKKYGELTDTYDAIKIAESEKAFGKTKKLTSLSDLLLFFKIWQMKKQIFSIFLILSLLLLLSSCSLFNKKTESTTETITESGTTDNTEKVEEPIKTSINEDSSLNSEEKTETQGEKEDYITKEELKKIKEEAIQEFENQLDETFNFLEDDSK